MEDQGVIVILFNLLAVQANQHCHIMASMSVAKVGQNGHDLIWLEVIGDRVTVKDWKLDHLGVLDHGVLVHQVASVKVQTFVW